MSDRFGKFRRNEQAHPIHPKPVAGPRHRRLLHIILVICLAFIALADRALADTVVSGSTYTIVNYLSGRVIDDPSWSTTSNQQLWQYHIDGSAKQRWTANLQPNGTWAFFNSYNNLALTVNGTANSAPLTQATWTGSSSQQWNIVAVGDGTYKLVNSASGKVIDDAGRSTNDSNYLIQYTDNSGTNQHWIFMVNPLGFPLSAGQRSLVTCIENPSVSYDIYLPSQYSGTANPLPILYTLNPSGGGMVSNFMAVSSTLNCITVGILGSSNSATYDQVIKEFYAVSLDIRQRVLFDPTAVFAAGFSGGGENAFVYSRFASQLTSGVLSMGGWLGCYYGYYSTFGVQSGLLVARATGNTDSNTIYWLSPDASFLNSYGAVVNDWSFSGGHVVPPDATKSACLTWLLANRTPAAPNDQQNALAQAATWRANLAAGQRTSVLFSCMTTLMTQPRTWMALEAQLVLDDLMKSDSANALLDVSSLATGDFASDLFYYYGRGAALNGDLARYHSALKLMTGVSNTSGARAGDLNTLLTNSGYTAPALRLSLSNGNVYLSINKNTPGLSYSLQTKSDLSSGSWSVMSASSSETNTLWSASTGIPAGTQRSFYTVSTTPAPGTSPPPGQIDLRGCGVARRPNKTGLTRLTGFIGFFAVVPIHFSDRVAAAKSLRRSGKVRGLSPPGGAIRPISFI